MGLSSLLCCYVKFLAYFLLPISVYYFLFTFHQLFFTLPKCFVNFLNA